MLYPFAESKTYNKLAFSAYCAAALIHLMRRQRDAVGLSLFSDSVYLQTGAKVSSVHAQRLYNELTQLVNQSKTKESFNRKTTVAQSLHTIAENIPTRSLVVLFSDMFDDEHEEEEIFSALQHLKFNKHEVIVFHVVDRKYEQQFEFENRPHKFISLETGEEIKINPSEIRDYYKKSITGYFESIKVRCLQYKIDLIEVDIKNDFSNVLTSYLVKRNNLF